MRVPFLFVFAFASAHAFGQAQSANPKPRLSLDQAVQMAKERNGTIRAAAANLAAARARSTGALTAFSPEVSSSFSYTYRRNEVPNPQFGARTFVFDQKLTQIEAGMTFLDSGQRDTNFRQARRSEEATAFQLDQTIRQTLFNVQQTYYETLRSQELLKVADAQVLRANTILDQTKARVQVGDAAQREILQATADALNAQVQTITAKNRVATNGASLKATVGLEQNAPLPELEPISDNLAFQRPSELDAEFDFALQHRPDLAAQKKQLEAQKFALKRSLLAAGLTFNVNGNYQWQVFPDRAANQSLSMLLSYPLFDGGARRAEVRTQRATLTSNVENLTQAERAARAEIESSFIQLSQNIERLNATKVAVEAARLNYAAAVGAQSAGAGDLIQVLTAQVSLVTAEANFIEATFDTLISELRFKLVTGRPLPGE
jgi:outer membrane protein